MKKRDLALLFGALSAACVLTKTSDVVDRRRLLAMAIEEAGLIQSAKDRLSRQLNLAHRQILEGQQLLGRATLASARATLVGAGDLEEQARLAGWVSLSELSRKAGDLASAKDACGEVLRFLRRLEPVRNRVDYVRGAAREVRALDGPSAAAALLREGSAWAERIEKAPERRIALAAIAWDLFVYQDYPGGLGVLRRDPDPAWRTDTLANIGPVQRRKVRSFGKSLSFEDNYYVR